MDTKKAQRAQRREEKSVPFYAICEKKMADKFQRQTQKWEKTKQPPYNRVAVSMK